MFLKTVEGFPYTPEADTPVDSYIKVGKLAGVTRDNISANSTGYVWFSHPYSVYDLPTTATSAEITRGTEVKLSDGAISAVTTNDTAIGICWEDTASGSTSVKVMIY